MQKEESYRCFAKNTQISLFFFVGIKMYDPKIDFDGDARAAVSRKAKSVKRLADQLKSKLRSF